LLFGLAKSAIVTASSIGDEGKAPFHYPLVEVSVTGDHRRETARFEGPLLHYVAPSHIAAIPILDRVGRVQKNPRRYRCPVLDEWLHQSAGEIEPLGFLSAGCSQD
jgi:hypothetical protein